jgi:1-acyl-sn-glycerol-3-phosphate acyltransferase
MTGLGKVLLALLADVKIHGEEKLPQKGPMILAGNHAAVLEAVMMAVYNPGMVEFIGNGDIPFDPSYAFIVNAYGLIPVNRGNLDRKSLNTAINLLEQGGILGIFPEGGIWDPAQMSAQIGAAWISYRAQVPIIPVGFGGIKDGLKRALAFKRPRLVMNVGDVIPPVTLDSGESMKTSLEKSANQIMKRINALVPEEDLRLLRRKIDESFALKITVLSEELDEPIPVPSDLQVRHGAAYARFLYNPTMLDVLYRNLRLPISPLMHTYRRSDLQPLITAWEEILGYLKVNPGFFTYRFGMEEGLAVERTLKELCQLGRWAQGSGYMLTICPAHRYRNANTGAQVTERGGCFPSSMQASHKKKHLRELKSDSRLLQT